MKKLVVACVLSAFAPMAAGRLEAADPSATDAIVAHVEKEVCPAIVAGEVAGLPVFRFPADKRPHAVFIVSDDHYHADKTLPAFARLLEDRYGFRCTVAHGRGKADIPGLDALETADVAVLYVRRLTLPNEQLDRIRAYLDAGKPLVALRTASHAFHLWTGDSPAGTDQWPEFDRDVLGGNYENHNNASTEVNVVPSAADHPILAGVAPPKWISNGTLYLVSPIDERAAVLLTGSSAGRTEPLAWTRQYKGGRVFYTSLGHWDDFTSPQFLTMLINAACWAMDRPPPTR